MTTTADMRTVVSSRTRVDNSSVSLTGISSGVHTAINPVWRGSERMSSIQSVWLRISPTLTRSLIAWGAASWPMMWPLAGGVHHHQVVVRLAHLPAELAHREDLAHTGGGGRHEVERLGQWPDPPHHRDAQVELEVLAQRRLRVHRHGPDPGRDLPRREVGGRRLEERRHVALGVDLADQDSLAVLGRQLGQARGDRRLAHAALAGDEHQPQIEQVGRPRSPLPRLRLRHGRPQGAPNPTRRSEDGAPTST